MAVEYLILDGNTSHYDSFMDSISIIGFTDKDKIDSINAKLKYFHGKLISAPGWNNSIGILGIEFTTEEDLLYFKLKFN